MEGVGNRTYTPSSWSQKSAAGEGAARPQGGGAEQAWDGLVHTVLCRSRPAGAVLGLQPLAMGFKPSL